MNRVCLKCHGSVIGFTFAYATWLAIGLGGLLVGPNPVWAQNDVARSGPMQGIESEASWRFLLEDELRTRIQNFVDGLDRAEERQRLQSSLEKIWTEQAGEASERVPWDRLNRVLAILEAGYAPLIQIRQKLAALDDGSLPPSIEGELDQLPEGTVRDHVLLAYLRWLVQRQFYDEAITVGEALNANQLWLPETLFYYRAIARHQLLEKELSLQDAERLLENARFLPKRYVVMAQMIRADLQPLEADSLDEVSRMMNDIRRRTAFHRAGKTVRTQELEVIEKLDKLIAKMEQQRQQQQQQASRANQPSGTPMQDSKAAGDKGEGKVANKTLPDGGQWGNLPPAQRAAALAELTRDLPPHYRAAIENYFRKLATDEDLDR